MNTRRLISSIVGAWLVGSGIADAGDIVLLQDHYQATAQLTTCAGATCLATNMDVIDVASQSLSGSILGASGINTFNLVVGESLTSASVVLRESEASTLPSVADAWEASVIGYSEIFGPLDASLLGTRFDSYWEFIADGDDVSLFTHITFESGRSPTQLTLTDLTLGATVFAFSDGVSSQWWNVWTPLENGHRYSLTASLALRSQTDPDTRLHVGSNVAFVPTRVPDTANTMLLFGIGLSAMAILRRRIVSTLAGS